MTTGADWILCESIMSERSVKNEDARLGGTADSNGVRPAVMRSTPVLLDASEAFSLLPSPPSAVLET